MSKETIELHDWMRILVGEAPPAFFIEIILRTIVVYLILMIAFRLIGSRMAGQLNRGEQAALVTLAAAIGVPIQAPERGLLPALGIALIVVVASRIIASRSSRHEQFERISQGNIDTLIRDGVLSTTDISKTTLTRERIFAQLRSEGIVQLGQVKRFYIESDGSFTLLESENKVPGLCILPENDPAFAGRFPRSEKLVCAHCGKQRDEEKGACYNCGQDHWVNAVTDN